MPASAASASFSIRRSSRGSARSSSRRGPSSKAFCPACTAVPFKGFSVEFAEYRQYMPGDDLATIDWKVYARSDRHYIKKFEEETNLDCHLMLDISGSMGYGSHGDHEVRIRRSASPRRSAYLMNRQRDAVGLTAFDDRIVDDAAGERAAGASARAARHARSARARAQTTSRSRCTSSPTR